MVESSKQRRSDSPRRTLHKQRRSDGPSRTWERSQMVQVEHATNKGDQIVQVEPDANKGDQIVQVGGVQTKEIRYNPSRTQRRSKQRRSGTIQVEHEGNKIKEIRYNPSRTQRRSSRSSLRSIISWSFRFDYSTKRETYLYITFSPHMLMNGSLGSACVFENWLLSRNSYDRIKENNQIKKRSIRGA